MTRRPSIEPGHVRLGPGLINENKPAQTQLLLAPLSARPGNIWSILFRGPERLFFNLRSSVFSVAHIRPLLAATLCSACSQDLNSAMVTSGRAATSARMTG